MVKIGIIGATGYVGAELLRLLLSHPKVEVVALSSVSFEGQEISNVYTSFFNKTNLICESAEDVVEKSDVIFTALPHGLSEDIAKKAIDNNKICIDMGADFRLSDENEYEEWYGKKFTQPELHSKSVYGLPELNREKIKECSLIANPGCYPTTIELGLMPLLKNSLIKLDGIICDSKSGTTGAGRGLTLNTHFPEENETFAPYKVGAHRHTPEIEETLTNMANDKVNVTFTPHLLPINRGILSTIYCSPKNKINIEEIHKLYVESYKNEPFVNILPLGETASIKNVRLTNDCFISLHSNHKQDQLIIVSTIDNMIKGAAGQAIQNMNIVLGFDETDGLKLIAPAF